MLLFVNFTSINAEYQEAVAAFPFELAPGFSFPLALVDNDERTEYGVGYGRMMAWLYWIAGVEAAVCDAHEAGNAEEARRLLFVARLWPDTDVYRACAVGDLDCPASSSWQDFLGFECRGGGVGQAQVHLLGPVP